MIEFYSLTMSPLFFFICSFPGRVLLTMIQILPLSTFPYLSIRRLWTVLGQPRGTADVPSHLQIDAENLRTYLNRLFKTDIAGTNAQWFRTAKNPDVSTGPLACPFALLLALLTHSAALIHSLASCSLTHS